LKGEEMKEKQYRSWFGGGIVGIFNGLLGGRGGMTAVPILQAEPRKSEAGFGIGGLIFSFSFPPRATGARGKRWEKIA